MPIYAGKTIENLTPSEAVNRGYLMPEDGLRCIEWIAEKLEQRQFNTIVYVNGVYVGVSKRDTVLWKIIDKFKIA